MTTDRLEAFSDGVIAIIITIMVFSFGTPHGTTLRALRPIVPQLLTYVLSFIYIGIYWSNHHHLLRRTKEATGGILWANLYLLFWLSLLPFATSWMGENHFAKVPVAVYGVVLFMAAIAYYILELTIVAHEGTDSLVARAIGRDRKGRISLVIYVCALGACVISRWLAIGGYVVVACIWLIPDRRLERIDTAQ